MTLLWWLAAAFAAPLSLDEVLASADARAPVLLAAAAKVDEAEGKQLSTRGAFDPIVSGKVGGYALDYPRTVAGTSVSVRSALGPSFEAGWALGDGEFPAYDGDRATGEQGELWVATSVPLLDGLLLGPEVAALRLAGAAVIVAEAERDDKRVAARQKATEAWWKWVTAGAKLAVEEDLLQLAVQRDAALTREVTEGARPRIELLDNQRVLLDRRAKVADAIRGLEVAAQGLSLWLRDEQGRPRVPSREDLPPLDAAPPAEGDLDALREQALQRPDVRALDALVEAAGIEVGRANNAALPDLSVYGVASRDLADGDSELQAGATVKVAALMRKERGERDRARALLTRLQAERTQAADQAIAELLAARAAVDATWQRVSWAREAERAAAEVRDLEERRFELGGGDLLQLLVRESNLANSRRTTVEATLEHHLAQAALAAAIGALPEG